MTTIISLQNISYFRNGNPLLKNVNWQVKDGEHWALLGPNGCGKTTMMKMIAGWMFPSEGNIEVLGHRFGEANLTELRKRIGWVTGMLSEEISGNLTAREVVLSGALGTIGIFEDPTDEQNEITNFFIDLLQINNFADRKFELLSQGERTRSMIARALASQPLLLILDEPCTGLDPVSRDLFLQNIETLTKHEGAPPVLLITHHIEEIVPGITNVIALNNGEKVIEGTKEEVLTAENLEKIFNAPFEIHKSNKRYFGQPVHEW